MRIGLVIAACVALAAATLPGRGGGPGRETGRPRGPKLGEPDVQKWKFGIVVSASDGAVGRLTGTTTVPMAWPEQAVKLVDQDLSAGVTVSYKSLGTAKQMVVNIPRVEDGKEVHAILTMVITRHTLLPPDDTDLYVVPDPKTLPADIKQFLNPSPLIESSHARIKAVAKQLGEGQSKAWPHVRAIYDWVRKTIHYQKDAPLTGSVEAIEKQSGDCNQLTLAFIAICRASGIAARTVQIPSHCYPEFYLCDEKGKGTGSRPSLGQRGLWRHLHAHADHAEGRRLSHSVPTLAREEARDVPPPALESQQSEPAARRQADDEIDMRTSGMKDEG